MKNILPVLSCFGLLHFQENPLNGIFKKITAFIKVRLIITDIPNTAFCVQLLRMVLMYSSGKRNFPWIIGNKEVTYACYVKELYTIPNIYTVWIL